MPSVSQAVLRSWSVPPAASLALALTAVVYLRGWLCLRRARVPFVPAWRAVSFLLGLLTVWIALASPLDTFSSFLIAAHMLQHMLLMMVAPPLVLLGAPIIPLVRGLPVFARRELAGPFVRWRVAVGAGRALTKLWVALVVMGLAMFVWHTPRLYELALASSSWHEVEHACFFIASLVFWWPVVQPWPSRAQAPRWAVVPYLLIGDIQNTILSAILVFSDHVLYPSYGQMPRLFGLSALQDQAASGAVMWVLGSLAFVVPAVAIGIRCLSGNASRSELQPHARSSSSMLHLRWAERTGVHRWLNTRIAEAVIFVALFAAAGLCLAALASRSDDDDQALRACESSGPFTIAVFSAPGELETGANTFSVLVQDSRAREVLLDTIVELRASHERASQNETAEQTHAVRANVADSDNKLLQSAELSLPSEGGWSLRVTVRSDSDRAEMIVPLKVVKAEEGRAVPWAYLVLLLFAAVLLFAYVLRHRASSARATIASSPQAVGAQELELQRRSR